MKAGTRGSDVLEADGEIQVLMMNHNPGVCFHFFQPTNTRLSQCGSIVSWFLTKCQNLTLRLQYCAVNKTKKPHVHTLAELAFFPLFGTLHRERERDNNWED